ncbi:MAG: nsrR [Phycisphaerales bacterium]|nr:nsrR [Phycisphaerales bacterium]
MLEGAEVLSQTVEYALRVMIHLADQEGPTTTKRIAVVTRVPEGYLAKVVRSLGKAGLLRSQRGLHGGSVLARPASNITVRDVVNAIEPVRRITTCPLGLPSHGSRLCPMHKLLDEAAARAEEVLDRSTLADLLTVPTLSKSLCGKTRLVPMPSWTIVARAPAVLEG